VLVSTACTSPAPENAFTLPGDAATGGEK
jgi:hypothetical protein